MKIVFVAVLFFHAALAFADDRGVTGSPSAPEPCSWLMTEQECNLHKRVLEELRSNDSARLNYLEHHLALLQEREALCACQPNRTQMLVRARYR